MAYCLRDIAAGGCRSKKHRNPATTPVRREAGRSAQRSALDPCRGSLIGWPPGRRHSPLLSRGWGGG